MASKNVHWFPYEYYQVNVKHKRDSVYNKKLWRTTPIHTTRVKLNI